jgi:hypothetical protein
VAGSIDWPGGLNLSYDTLYLESKPIGEEALEQARQTASGMEMVVLLTGDTLRYKRLRWTISGYNQPNKFGGHHDMTDE